MGRPGGGGYVSHVATGEAVTGPAQLGGEHDVAHAAGRGATRWGMSASLWLVIRGGFRQFFVECRFVISCLSRDVTCVVFTRATKKFILFYFILFVYATLVQDISNTVLKYRLAYITFRTLNFKDFYRPMCAADIFADAALVPLAST